MTRRNGNVTIRDVAQLAGVVPSTVSHAINHTAPVSEETRQRVFEAIQKLGYRRNTLASSLRQQMSMTLGLLLANVADPLEAEIAAGVSEVADREGYSVLIGTTSDEAQAEDRQLARLLDRRVDGLIIVSTDSERRLHAYNEIDIPLVLVNRQTPNPLVELPSVEVDNQQAGYLATRHLLDLGHSAIGIITTSLSNERCEGYRRALEEAGLPVRPELIYIASLTETDLMAQGYMAMVALLNHAPLSACFVVDDMRAIGAIEALRDRKLRVPEDVAIVGCGDLSLAALVCPRLTTVGHPKRHLGAQAVHLLLELFNNSLIDQRVILPCELVVRESCGAYLHPGWRPSRSRLRLS
ncbi:MAG: LacI family transcriptional regulator [Chloroflexales bacterium]|nr:LacI family transcriptional regulator [Chloroflexales bacterium]